MTDIFAFYASRNESISEHLLPVRYNYRFFPTFRLIGPLYMREARWMKEAKIENKEKGMRGHKRKRKKKRSSVDFSLHKAKMREHRRKHRKKKNERTRDPLSIYRYICVYKCLCV